MGTKGSGPYFQRVITTQMLDGLIYLICELYIDDVRRRRHVRQQREASFLSVPKTEENRTLPRRGGYVGHLVSHKGVSFTKEKRQKIQNFERPRTHKEMLMYVGLVNYFHDHVRNMNDLLRPLRQMVERYDKHKRLEWSPELIRIYEESRHHS